MFDSTHSKQCEVCFCGGFLALFVKLKRHVCVRVIDGQTSSRPLLCSVGSMLALPPTRPGPSSASVACPHSKQ